MGAPARWPLKPGRCGTLTHDYKRHGTTTLFAALNLLDGAVIGHCMPQHRHQEFIRFLKRVDGQTPPGLNLHLIVDKATAYKELEPAFAQSRIELLDHPQLTRELKLLERKPRPGGRDMVDHPRGCHDDYANSLALAAMEMLRAEDSVPLAILV